MYIRVDNDRSFTPLIPRNRSSITPSQPSKHTRESHEKCRRMKRADTWCECPMAWQVMNQLTLLLPATSTGYVPKLALSVVGLTCFLVLAIIFWFRESRTQQPVLLGQLSELTLRLRFLEIRKEVDAMLVYRNHNNGSRVRHPHPQHQ
jgi:hypothetical protein